MNRFRIDPFLTGTGTEQNVPARITIEQQVAHEATPEQVMKVKSSYTGQFLKAHLGR